jgi:2-keto-3-deoxy-L-rhamnonate aldolase RhmA
MIAPDNFAGRLRRRERLLGTVLTLPCVALAELAGESLDFVWIDLEHGALGTADVQPLAIAARAAGCAAVVRLPSAGACRLQAIVDAGIDGVVAPRVDSAAEARRLVERLRYPPRGSRGFAARRAVAYGGGGLERQGPVCIAQIESTKGVEAAERIAAVGGVDALVVGCSDLALALDGGLELPSERVRDAIARVESAAASAGIACGVAGPDDPQLLRELAGNGSTVFVCSADVRIYAHGLADLVAGLRARLGCEQEGSRVGA